MSNVLMQEKSGNTCDINNLDYLDEYAHKNAEVSSLVFMGGRKKESLNGRWNYAIDQYDCCLNQHWWQEKSISEEGFTLPQDYSFDSWPVMNLPCSWNMESEKLFLYESPMLFTRTFSFKKKANERVFLRIGAANYACRVFLNRNYIGAHFGGSTPFMFDVTETISETNRILLVVDATRRPDQVPMYNTDWFNYGGVYRDIDLVRVPDQYIKDFKVSLVPDGTFNKISVSVKMSTPITSEARFVIDELAINELIPIKNGYGNIVINSKPILWSPENPKLYNISIATETDSVSDLVGFREITIVNHDIIINGKKVFLRGISCHEDDVERGKAFTEADCIKIMTDAKELGCNFMRLAHYPHTEMMSKTADRLGIMLWEEIPVYWHIQFNRPETYHTAENMLLELITRDYNRASVIIWSVGNENPDTESRLSFMRRLAETARDNDNTRKIGAACLVSNDNVIADRLAEYLDVIGINEYIGWYDPDFSKLPELFEKSKPSKPVIITEVGAGAMPGHHGSNTDKFTEEYQEYVYERQISEIRKIPYIKGMTPWILYDFRCPRRTNALQDYYNRKGLISPNREHKKRAFYTLQKFYNEIASEY